MIKAETNEDFQKIEVTESHIEWCLTTLELFCRHKAIEGAILASATGRAGILRRSGANNERCCSCQFKR